MSALPKLKRDKRLNIIDDLDPNDFTADIRDYVQGILAYGREARRFIFGDEASFEIGRFINGCEDILLDNRHFARPPFPGTYVEVTIPEINRGIGRGTYVTDTTTSDDRLGFLITGNYVRVICTSKSNGPAPGAWNYRLNTPETLALNPDMPMREKQEWARLLLLLGTTTEALKDEQQRLAICYETSIRSNITQRILAQRTKGVDGQITTNFVHFVRGAAGELRTLWAALLLINQHRQRLHFSEVGRTVALTPQRKVYQAHTLVALPLTASREAARKTYYPNTRASPVGHEVRGHWTRWHLSSQCLHDWDSLPDDNGHFQCKLCKGWRTWRKPHHRGNSAAGINLQTWEVTP